jgi:hypothetical protein
MAFRQPYCKKQAFDHRGDESYEAQMYPKIEAGNQGGIIVINPACSH